MNFDIQSFINENREELDAIHFLDENFHYDYAENYLRQNPSKNFDWDRGCKRFVIIPYKYNFVIKRTFNYFGIEKQEFISYDLIPNDFKHLFCKPFLYKINDCSFIVMEKVKVDGGRWIDGEKDYKSIKDYLAKREIDFLNKNFKDIHEGNWGFRDNGDVVIFDYTT